MGELGLQILRLELRVDAAALQPFADKLIAAAFRVRLDGEIPAGLQDVLHPSGVPGHECHHLPAGAHIEEVVAQCEVKELPLPDPAAVVAAFLIAEIILVNGVVAFDSVCHGLMPHALVLLSLALKGKRQHSLETAALHVHDDGLAGVIGKVLFRAGNGVLERVIGIRADADGVHQHQLVDAVAAPAAEERGVISNRLRAVLVNQPAADEHMPGDGDYERVEADGLQDRCHQDARIGAGADLFLQHIRRQADALPGALKARGRHGVEDALLAEGVKHRCSLCPHAVGVPGLVAVEGGVAGELFEYCTGPRLYGGELRRVRSDE